MRRLKEQIAADMISCPQHAPASRSACLFASLSYDAFRRACVFRKVALDTLRGHANTDSCRYIQLNRSHKGARAAAAARLEVCVDLFPPRACIKVGNLIVRSPHAPHLLVLVRLRGPLDCVPHEALVQVVPLCLQAA